MGAVDRQAIFSGTEEPPQHLALDVAALGRYLKDKVEGLGETFQVAKFKGGQSNPTYKLSGPGATFVLRRQPPGPLLQSAHAIDREYRVMQAVGRAGFPAPTTFLYCDDDRIIGSAFYIVSFNEGRVFWNADIPGATAAQRTAIYKDMSDRLAELHQMDYRAIGLDDFGRIGGYAARNLARWSKIYKESALVDVPDMDWLIRTLPERVPQDEKTCLLHGDFGLYNLIISPRNSIAAVLDWEMSTLGDPFIDLAHHVRAWWEIPDPDGGTATSLVDQDLSALGIPTMNDYIDRYCRIMGLAELPHRRFYLGYAQFRTAAMIQGILRRMAVGTSSSRVTVHTQDRVFALAALARRTIEGSES